MTVSNQPHSNSLEIIICAFDSDCGKHIFRKDDRVGRQDAQQHSLHRDHRRANYRTA